MAHIPRLYVSEACFDDLITLDEGQSHYLLRVMRMDAGASVRAFNGRDGEWACALDVKGKRALLEPVEQIREQVSVPDLRLFFAPVKKNRTDFIVEKATELGVSHIQPIQTQFTQNTRVRADKLEAIAIEAAEQSERMDVPEIAEITSLTSALHDWDRAKPLFYCDEGGDAKPMQKALETMSVETAGILIGPEGGFSDKEREKLRSLDFVIPVTLGPRILRAETAVVSALSLWQSQVGDWQQQPYLA